MLVKDTRELFVMMLSDLRQAAERSGKVFEQLGELAQDSDVKEALRARAFISDKMLNALDECFNIIGEKPSKNVGKLQEIMVEDFRKELAEIQAPDAKRLFILAKAIGLASFRIAEYKVLIAAADLTGHPGVGVLLETCLADKLAFVERTRRLIRDRMQSRMAA